MVLENIIPAIRGEAQLRETSTMSPVKRHVGLYAYHYNALKVSRLQRKRI